MPDTKRASLQPNSGWTPSAARSRGVIRYGVSELARSIAGDAAKLGTPQTTW